MIDEQTNTQNQTVQPAPGTQSPQPSSDSDLQGTVDRESLDSTGQSINLSTPRQQTATTGSSPSEQSSSQSYDIGLGLLIAVFVFALLMILSLAWVAIKRSRKTQTNNEQEAYEKSGPDDIETKATNQINRGRKKPTRRQRRKQ